MKLDSFFVLAAARMSHGILYCRVKSLKFYAYCSVTTKRSENSLSRKRERASSFLLKINSLLVM